jgi:hypothetical protein
MSAVAIFARPFGGGLAGVRSRFNVSIVAIRAISE